MKKRLLLIALVIVLSTGTVVQTEMHAEAAATVTAVGVAKAVLVLLAIAGVGITLGTIFDNDAVGEETVSGFTTWLNNHDPEFYTEFAIASAAITAGRVVNTLSPLFYHKLKQYAAEYFGTSTETETVIGTSSFNINQLAIMPNGTQYVMGFSAKVYTNIFNYNVIPVYIKYGSGSAGRCFFLPTKFSDLTSNPAARYLNKNATSYSTNVNGISVSFLYWDAYGGSSITFFDPKITVTSENQMISVFATVASKYYNGEYNSISEDVVAKPFVTVGNVAATSAEACVVSAGQTITEDENGEIVIDGDTTLNLTGVNIDNWLQSLAEGTQTYAEAMQAIGLAAVNTQTQTLEEVQAIAEALNPAAAGTGTITGNYTVALSDLFPFCIPFDLYNIISCFKADPVAPSAEITIPVGYDGAEFTWETYTVSLSAFDPVAAVVRVLEYVAFVVGLMLVTRKLIEG